MGVPWELRGQEGAVVRGVFALFRRGIAEPFLTVGNEGDVIEPQAPTIEREPEGITYRLLRPTPLTYEMRFSRDGRLFAMGTQDGRVMVYDIKEVERQLKELGL